MAHLVERSVGSILLRAVAVAGVGLNQRVRQLPFLAVSIHHVVEAERGGEGGEGGDERRQAITTSVHLPRYSVA